MKLIKQLVCCLIFGAVLGVMFLEISRAVGVSKEVKYEYNCKTKEEVISIVKDTLVPHKVCIYIMPTFNSEEREDKIIYEVTVWNNEH